MKIAQFSDCHLFTDKAGLHYGANVYQHLLSVLKHIVSQPEIELAIFTGDLSQDHSADSYQLFVEAVKESAINIPLYFLCGNHDEPELMNKYLLGSVFHSDKTIAKQAWKILLLNSKSETPAGIIDEPSLASITSHATNNQSSNSTNVVAEINSHVLLMMHHHPIDIGFSIDRHGLQNKTQFWQAVEASCQVKAIACGHVHNGVTLSKVKGNESIPLFTCPATSVEFDRHSKDFSVTTQGPGYQVLQLNDDGNIDCQRIYLAKYI